MNEKPVSPCCGATMYGVNKKSEFGFKTLDYIYCSKCKRHLDGNGKRIEPPRFHGGTSILLMKESRKLIFEFKEDSGLIFWKVVWVDNLDNSATREVRIFRQGERENDYKLIQTILSSLIPGSWVSIDVVKEIKILQGIE